MMNQRQIYSWAKVKPGFPVSNWEESKSLRNQPSATAIDADNVVLLGGGTLREF